MEDPSFHYYRGDDGFTKPRHGRSGTVPLADVPSPNNSYWTSQNFGIVIAIFVIILFQRKDGFGRLLAARRDRGLLSATLDIIVEGAAYIKSSVQIVLELFRNLRCHLLANGDDWLFTEPTMPTSPMSTSGSPKARGRRRNAASVMAPVTSRIVTGRLPELEDLDETKRNQDDETNEESLDTTRENTNSLEPAFVKDEDYPPGWLVFDPHLGIVSKAEADRYKRDQMRKRAEHVKQQNFDTHDKQQQPQPQQKLDTKDSKCNNPQNRPLRTNNAMPKASQMHTPQTIAANG